MLKPNRPRARRPKKVDWFPVRPYKHVDPRPNREAATALVESPTAVARHGFLPFITFQKIERRFRRTEAGTSIKQKIRRLAYCSNWDACVYGYYAELLRQPYERLLRARGLDDVVIGYRRKGSNIAMALEAFREIASRRKCTAFAFDISAFFDNIDHATLKTNWCDVLGKERLPDDHFQVFSELTNFIAVDRRALLRRLGYSASAKDSDLPGPPLCSIKKFRQVVRGDDGIHTNLLIKRRSKRGIPQGSPISAIAANISMLRFDGELNAAVVALEGSYRRYSDDILIIVPDVHRHKVRPLLDRLLGTSAGRLKTNDKTKETAFDLGKPPEEAFRPLQYLGFLYDGERVLIRPNTIARYWRRIYKEVRRAKRLHQKAQAEPGSARTSIHMKSLLRKTTHLGADSLISTYVRQSRSLVSGDGVRRQFRKHQKKIVRLVSKT